MSCPRLEQSVFLHAHGQLQGFQNWWVESHLRRCSVCRAQWAQWTVERDRLRRALAPMPADPVGLTGLSAAVGARIRTERAMPGDAPPSRPRFSPAMVAVALATTSLAAGISAFAAFWMPSADHCSPASQIPPPVSVVANVPGNCPNRSPAPAANQPAEKCPQPPGPSP